MTKQDLLHPSEPKRAAFGAALWAAAGMLAMPLPACTHTLLFSDPNPIVVRGTPPAPPPERTEPVKEVKPVETKPKRVEVKADHIEITEKIQFETAKATIRPESSPLLDEITNVVKQNPQIRRLSIEGHTDNTGADKLNQKLSEQRAAAVRDYLVQHGVESDRLLSRGWGKTKPIDDNSTANGREANRRVEFVIIEQTGQTGTGGAPEKPTAPVEGAPE
jgi:outer membrane protein OmpA-like peptidoglycan-associated protein